jgi:pimeloyl-ACP methyl ester carboxylesterase
MAKRQFVPVLIGAALLVAMTSATLVATGVSTAQAPASVAGVWSGAIETPGIRLNVVVRLQLGDGGAWSGTIDIPQQGTKAIALSDVAVTPPTISFRIPGAPGDPTIRLTLSDDGGRMSGTLSQGGGTVPVSLARGEAQPVARVAPRRPQMPTRPVPYAEEEVTFRNTVADLQLAGTLTLPRSTGRVPAVLLITGSGQQDRDETVFDHKPFWVWADHLTRLGVAVLRVDDRGIGGSGRGPQNATSMDFADDVRAGLAYLRARPEIDPKRVGMIGHSEGAMLAAMVAASSSDAAFIVMLAGPGLPGDQILYSQAALIFKAQGASDAVIAWDRSVRERVFSSLKAETDGKPNTAVRQTLLDEIGSAKSAGPGLPDGAAGRKLAEALFAAGSGSWFRFFLAFDPRPALMKVRVPVLAIGGDRDLQVPAGDNLAAIERAVRSGGNTDVTVVSLAGLNHLFQTSTSGSPAEYGTIEETIAPAVLKLVSDWIVKRVF